MQAWVNPFQPPLSENCDFSGTEPERSIFLGLSGGPTKFENTFFQIAKLRFSTIFNDFWQNSEFSKNSQGTSLKARGLIFWILALYTSI